MKKTVKNLITASAVIAIVSVIAFIVCAVAFFLSPSETYALYGAGKRPTDFPMTRWVCEEADMYFDVPAEYSPIVIDGVDTFDTCMYGAITVNGQYYGVRVNFGYGSEVFFDSSDTFEDQPYTMGACDFSTEKLVVTIDKERDGFEPMKGRFDTLTFIRQPVDESELTTLGYTEIALGPYDGPQ